MQFAKLWQNLLGVERTVVEKVVFDEDEWAVVVSVRPRKGATRRCGVCSRRCAWYDRGEGRRRWRSLDLGAIPVWLEADAPRVCCPEHGVVVAAFPWARELPWVSWRPICLVLDHASGRRSTYMMPHRTAK